MTSEPETKTTVGVDCCGDAVEAFEKDQRAHTQPVAGELRVVNFAGSNPAGRLMFQRRAASLASIVVASDLCLSRTLACATSTADSDEEVPMPDEKRRTLAGIFGHISETLASWKLKFFRR